MIRKEKREDTNDQAGNGSDDTTDSIQLPLSYSKESSFSKLWIKKRVFLVTGLSHPDLCTQV